MNLEKLRFHLTEFYCMTGNLHLRQLALHCESFFSPKYTVHTIVQFFLFYQREKKNIKYCKDLIFLSTPIELYLQEYDGSSEILSHGCSRIAFYIPKWTITNIS